MGTTTKVSSQSELVPSRVRPDSMRVTPHVDRLPKSLRAARSLPGCYGVVGALVCGDESQGTTFPRTGWWWYRNKEGCHQFVQRVSDADLVRLGFQPPPRSSSQTTAAASIFLLTTHQLLI